MILITGATGLTGSHLALHLIEKGEAVRAIYRDKTAVAKTRLLFDFYKKADLFDKIGWIQADITDIPSLEKAFQNIEYVYHCAAFISFDPADEEILRKTNIEGTANIVNCCLSYNVKKLCHVSSVAALGHLKGQEILTEEAEWNPEKPHNDYAISKYGAEMEIWRGLQEGLNVVVVNPGVILGRGYSKSGSVEVFTRVAKGQPFYTKGKPGFVDVLDVVTIMEKLMISDISGERFILVSESMSFQKLLNAIADVLVVKRPSFHAKPWMTSFAYRIDRLLSLLGKKRTLSKDGARALHTASYYSSEKIKKALDYQFIPVNSSIQDISGFYKK